MGGHEHSTEMSWPWQAESSAASASFTCPFGQEQRLWGGMWGHIWASRSHVSFQMSFGATNAPGETQGEFQSTPIASLHWLSKP